MAALFVVGDRDWPAGDETDGDWLDGDGMDGATDGKGTGGEETGGAATAAFWMMAETTLSLAPALFRATSPSAYVVTARLRVDGGDD